MKPTSFLICSLAFFVSLPIPMKGLYSGQAQETASSQIYINEPPVARPDGIKVKITGKNIQLVNFQIKKFDKESQDFEVYAYSIQCLTPEKFRTSDMSTYIFPLPIIIAADPEARYKIWASASPTLESNQWVEAPKEMEFYGFSSKVADTIDLNFTPEQLTISAVTNNIAVLRAGWSIPGTPENTKTILEESRTMQNPSLPLKFAALGQPSGRQGPALQISLEDPTRGIVQQALITLSVSVGSNTSLRSDVQTASQEPPTISPQKSKKFSWIDLAKTGISAILKYFLI